LYTTARKTSDNISPLPAFDAAGRLAMYLLILNFN